MATHSVTGPDGVTYEVTAPESASDADVLNFVQQQHAVTRPDTLTGTATPDPITGSSDTAVRWLTAGASDPIRAAMYAGTRSLLGPAHGERDQTFGQNYQSKIDELRAQASNFRAEYPILNAASAVAGGLIPAAVGVGTPATGASLGRAMATGAGIGGITGGVAGASDSNGSPLTDALIGVGLGTAIGAAVPLGAELVSPVTSALSRSVIPGSVDTQALERLGGRFNQSARAGGPGVPEATAMLTDPSINMGKPLSLADLGGTVQGLAGKVSRVPGESSQIATDFLGGRNSGAGPRIVGDINAVSPMSAFETGQQLAQQRSTNAAPLYQQAYGAPPINPDIVYDGGALDQLMSRPSMGQAANRALSLAQEEGRNPASLGIGFNPAGDPIFEQVPSWQTLDYVKRGLDDVLNSHRDPTSGRLVRDESVNAIDNTRREFINILDQNNPQYAAARQTWGGPTEALAAMKQGQSFRNYSPEELNNMFSSPPAHGGLTPNQQEFFRVGAFNTLRQGAGRTGTATGVIGNNAVNSRGADYLTTQLRPLFDTAAEANAFVQRMTHENTMLNTSSSILGNSATAARQMEDHAGHTGPGALANAATMFGAMAVGEPMVAAAQAPRLLSALSQVGERSADNPAVNAATARLLFNSDPQTNQATLARLLALGNRSRLRDPAIFGASQAAAQNYPTLLKSGLTLAQMLGIGGSGVASTAGAAR